MSEKKACLLGFLICLAATVAISGCIQKDDQDENGDMTVMTFGQYLVDSRRHVNNDTKQVIEWFQSLDEGDTLLIRDTINNIMYLEISDCTQIDFASSFLDDDALIQGDITNDFAPGDRVILQVTIIKDTFTWQDTKTGELWTYNLECVQEMWDTEQKTSNPLPSYCIHHAEK